MSSIPDCRTDEYYNEKYLKKADKDFIEGYDYAVEQISTLLQGNIDVFPELAEILDDNKAVIMSGKADKVVEAIEEWMEGQRDEMITSMIDNMNETEYESIKEKVDGQSEDKN